MAKKTGPIRKVVETVEGWVGMGSGAQKKKAKPAKKASAKKGVKKATGKRKAAKKTTKKRKAATKS